MEKYLSTSNLPLSDELVRNGYKPSKWKDSKIPFRALRLIYFQFVLLHDAILELNWKSVKSYTEDDTDPEEMSWPGPTHSSSRPLRKLKATSHSERLFTY